MKPKIDYKYLKICIYIVATAIVIYLAFVVIHSIPQISMGVVTFIKFAFRILKPLIIGLAFAYVLYSPTRAIERFFNNHKRLKIKSHKAQRIISICIAYIVIIGIIAAIVCGIYFMVGGQLSKNTTLSNIIEYISRYFKNSTISADSIENAITSLNIPFIDNFDLSTIAEWLQKFFSAIINSSVSSVVSIGSNIFSILIAFVLSIYLLYDSDYFKLLWRKFFFMIFRHTKAGKIIKDALSVINVTFTSYIKGQLIDAVIVAILSTIALSIVGVDFAFIIGIISGIFNLIPYVGPIIGTIIAALIALLGGNPWTALWAIIAMVIVQQVDGNVLAPRIIGQNVGLHPLFIMIAIIIGGSRGGLLGMLIAVPILASAKQLLAIWYNNHFGQAFLESEKAREKPEETTDNADEQIKEE
jgi:predicted PurR-regulated permease PerM